jgi:hypothetical protein
MLIHLFWTTLCLAAQQASQNANAKTPGQHEIASFELKQLFPNVTEKRDFPPGSPVQT